ncbi:MAG: hypothetical protein AAFY26_18545 [Cyanobacteria bacterium J06638_22]
MTGLSSPDDYRFYQLFRYLCLCLASKVKAGKPNYKEIADQLTDKKDFRKFVSDLYQKDHSDISLGKQSRLTTGELVEYLANLQTNLEAAYIKGEEPYTRLLTTEDVIGVLLRLIELTPDERQALRLPDAGDCLTLLQRSLLVLQANGGVENYELLFGIYKTAIGLNFPNAEAPLDGLEVVDALVEETVQQELAYVPERSPNNGNTDNGQLMGRDHTISDLILKAKREVRRLLARSGNQQSPVTNSTVIVDAYVQHYFQRSFVKSLARAIVANERLTDQFPVYLKYIAIKPSGPLPFTDKNFDTLDNNRPYPPVMQVSLREIEQLKLKSHGELPGPGDYELASQESNQVAADFYIKLPEGYQPVIPRVFERIASDTTKSPPQRIDFSLESTGIGGALSHVIKVINRALLRDIPCLSGYFSIAHDVTSTQAIIRENVASPVWAHSLVKLCRKETVGHAIQKPPTLPLPSYETFAFADPIGSADYCGFDFLSAQAQAALQARLQVIRHTGIMPAEYLTDLCHHTEFMLALQDAWEHLRGYPFSSLAMIGRIHEEILSTIPPIETATETAEVERNEGNTDPVEHSPLRPLKKGDRYIYFEAYLSITEALLDEGAYRKAYQYLACMSVLDEFVEQETAIASDSDDTNPQIYEIFSGSLLVRYLLCWANYFYLFDTRIEDEASDYRPQRRSVDVSPAGLIRSAWRYLELARQHIERRLRKYVVINEVSQGTFHPHYNLLARMEFLRAKLLLFFPRAVPDERSYLPTDQIWPQGRAPASIHWGRIYLTEKARLYAAADGNGELYACCAAIQSWMYLIMAFTPDYNRLTLSLNTQTSTQRNFSLGNLMEWAKQMRDHALLSYAEMGQQCYYQIKEKSGLPAEKDDFGSYRVQKIKPIYEARGPENVRFAEANPSFLVLDMSLLVIDAEDLPKITPNIPIRKIYLFGTNACYLFLARGMYRLCGNEAEEFGEAEPATQRHQWEAKLHHAMRLLNMAWAIAEEGGELRSRDRDPVVRFHIHRHTPTPPSTDDYLSQDVSAIRDLYPRRVTEIADWGKVFSAACMVLKLHMVPEGDRTDLLTDIERILHSLHGARRFNATLRHFLRDQQRYNGHLAITFDIAKQILIRYQDQALASPQPDTIQSVRDALLGELFQQLFE